MQIDKVQIIEFLNSRGEQDEAQRAEHQLPDQADADQHADLL